MKILNDWTVGGSLLLIGAGFFSTRFDMGIVIKKDSKLLNAEGGPADMEGASPESYTPQATASPDGYDVSDAGTGTESFAAEIDEVALEKKFTTKRVSRKPKTKMSTDTSKPKGKDKPWRMSKRAEGASSWSGAVGMARKDLGITGFEPIRKGSALYNRAKELYNKN